MEQAVKPPAPANDSSSFVMIRLMGAVSLICGLLIVTAHQTTLIPIRQNQETILKETVSILLPGVQKQVTYIVEANGELQIFAGGETALKRLIAGYDTSGALIGVVVEGSERGYADVIRAMYAYSPKQEAIVGFQVVELKETPGLGDKITSDKDFQKNFAALDTKLDAGKSKLAHPITAVKHGTKKNAWEIDAISGATISSRAVGRLLQKSTQEMIPVIVRNLNRIEKGE